MHNITDIKASLNHWLPSRDYVRAHPTDVDHWPYTRQFRGDPASHLATVWDRKAGFRPMESSCYVPEKVPQTVREWACWQTPCTYPKRCTSADCLPNI